MHVSCFEGAWHRQMLRFLTMWSWWMGAEEKNLLSMWPYWHIITRRKPAKLCAQFPAVFHLFFSWNVVIIMWVIERYVYFEFWETSFQAGEGLVKMHAGSSWKSSEDKLHLLYMCTNGVIRTTSNCWDGFHCYIIFELFFWEGREDHFWFFLCSRFGLSPDGQSSHYLMQVSEKDASKPGAWPSNIGPSS